MRIAGIDLPKDKRIEAALPAIFGVGWSLTRKILAKVGIDPNIRTANLTEEQMGRIAKELEKYKVEGELRAEIQTNIARLKDIGAYKGLRHAKNLPVRGQRTRSNARTKRGKRVTIGTVRKEVAARTGTRRGGLPTGQTPAS